MAEQVRQTVATQDAKPPTTIIVERKSSLPMVALVVALIVIAGIAFAWFAFGRADSADATAGGSSSSSAVYTVHLEGFTVNLADREDNHFLRVTLDLALDHLPPGTQTEKPSAKLPMARIRDTILSVLTECKSDVLLTPDGKNQLKKRLMEALNRDVPEIGVRDIYFTEFLVQR